MKLTALNKRLLSSVVRASEDYHLIEHGDRVMVGLSGGKDSYALMLLLDQVRRKAPFDFELIGVNLDQGHPGFEQQVIVDWCDDHGFAHHMVNQDTYSVVKEKTLPGKTYCSLCSRMRRGVLYRVAGELGTNKIALGHHRDDVIETLMLNLFYSGQLKAMPARLVSHGGSIVIRPLCQVEESALVEFSQEQDFPILPCVLCGTQPGMQRVAMKKLLDELSAKNPTVRGNLFAALGNVVPTHLYDRALLDAPERDDIPVRP